MITIHHLGHSQSERIVWLCEELALPYVLRYYSRDPVTRLAPLELKALHPLGAAPVIEDCGNLLAESGAIAEYIAGMYGDAGLWRKPGHPDYVQFLYWLHFANGSLQPAMTRLVFMKRARLAPNDPALGAGQERLARLLSHVDARLAGVHWLAGDEFSAADIMSVFSLTTMRLFLPVDLAAYPCIRDYLQRIGDRPAYRRAIARSDPDLAPLLE